MLNHSTRRLLAGLGVAGAFVAASATPAVAAEAPFKITAQDVLVAPGFVKQGWIYVSPSDTESEPAFGHTTLDVDLSKVADFAVVEPAWGWTCDVSPTKLHCETDLAENEQPSFDYNVTAKDDAEPGQQGDLTVTLTSGGKSATGTAGITIAEGVDLVSDEKIEVSGAPGTRVGVPAVVRNVGEAAVDGAVLVVQAEWLAGYGGDFSNCKSSDEGAITFCTFDTKIEPGRSYQLSEGLPLKLRPEVRTGAKIPAHLDWWTTDDWALTSWPESDVKPGQGDELRLVEQKTLTSRTPQTDVEGMNSSTIATVRVTGDNPADLAAKGAAATGKKGDIVTVEPSFTNLGPAVLEYQGQGTPEIRPEDLPVRISIPEGTTAVGAPFDCVPYLPNEEWDPWNAGWGEPGAKEYACQVTESPEGMNNPYGFELRIDEVRADATGTITTKLAGDPKSQNDTAKIIINPTNPGGGDGGQGGGDGDGGSLPITGESTALIGGIGALLLAAGVGGYVVARRRKTRFVA
ncbi:LPXTG cell wall anchor domain-containing protein [Micromonospora musae]|uniref:LPXTG cell wall anchor domain-containing protein n=1 Tax=Micromonospora musae TaxID=1894970 RepID=A0A3A9XTN1_9ACTN|nr:LPXTG cell wall anchor domain-containing protein [Micromonospora musae]RKN14067.1 LPXTG cell wall anchor domain-containing protein [Micromonospora musae]RKN28558.1 LPXTG cell wall anchor domain-containing protein [Micromonospora musae]